MQVNFTLLTSGHCWNAKIHQLNSDVLLRHISVSGQISEANIHLTYCETSSSGQIINSNNELIGNFLVS